MLMRATTALAFVVTLAGDVIAQDECFPNLIKFDICAQARTIQSKMASTLPMRLNAEITLQHIIAIGSRLSMTVVWHLSNSKLQSRMSAASMSRDDLKAKMEAQTDSMVCGDDALAAFVGLGGEIQYVYRTEDAVPVYSPLVTTCEIRVSRSQSTVSPDREMLLDHLRKQIANLSPAEKLAVVKGAENKITAELRSIARNPENQKDGYVWMMKVGALSYATITLLIEDSWPELSALYKGRAEIYNAYVRGQIEPADLEAKEQSNERTKATLFDRYLSDDTIQPLLRDDARAKALFDLGASMADEITSHAKVLASRRK